MLPLDFNKYSISPSIYFSRFFKNRALSSFLSTPFQSKVLTDRSPNSKNITQIELPAILPSLEFLPARIVKRRSSKHEIEVHNKKGTMNQKTLPSFSVLAQSILVNGVYEHYKGLRYKIVGVARHSETLEELVVYQALYGKSELWVRPLSMFLENIVINGQSQPRFNLIQ